MCNSNDDKRLQTFDEFTKYPYGTIGFKVSEIEMMISKDLFVKKHDEIVLQQ